MTDVPGGGEGFELAAAFVSVSPDTGDFQEKLEADLGDVDTVIQVPVVPDTGDFRAQMDAAVGESDVVVSVPVVPDVADFREQVDAALAGTGGAVEVPVVPDTAGFAAKVDSEVADTRATVEVPVIPDTEGFAAKVDAEVDSTKAAVQVPVIPDTEGFAAKVESEAEASKATAVVPLVPGDTAGFAEKTAAEADAAGLASGAGFGDKFANVAGQMPLFAVAGENAERDAAVAGEDSADGFGSRFRSLLSGLPLFGGAAAGIETEADTAGTEAGEGFAARFRAIVGGADLMELALGAAAIAVPAVLADKFQAAMTLLVTQAGVAKSALGGLESGVLSLASQVGESPDSLAAALYHVESSFQSTGITGANALKLLQTGAEGARLGNANLVDTQNALDATIKSGVSGVSNYGQAMGALNATVGAGDMTMQDLNKAMSTGIMAVAKSYGQSVQQVGAALATFGDVNIRGAKAATDLRMAIQGIAVPVATGKAALASIGLTMTDLGTTMRNQGLTPAIQEFVDHLQASKVPVNEWGTYVTEIFGKKAGVGIGVLVDQLANLKSKFPDIQHAMDDFGGAWATTQATLSQKLHDLESGFIALGTKIGLVLLPAISAIAGSFAGVLPAVERVFGVLTQIVSPVVTDFLRGLGTALKVLHGPLLDFAAALIGTKLALMAFNLVMDMNPMVRFGIVALLVVGLIEKLHGPLKIAAIAVAGLTAAFWLLNIAMEFNPVVDALQLVIVIVAAVVAAITALVLLIIKYHKQIWDAITSTWDKIAHFFEGLYDDIVPPVEKAFGAVKHAVLSVAGDIAGPVEDAFRAVKTAITGAFTGAFDDIAKPVERAFDAVKNVVTGGFDAWWKSHGAEVKEVWDAIWNAITSTVTKTWAGLVTVVKFGWSMVMDVFHAEEAALVNTFTTAWNVISTVVKVAWAVIEAFLKPAVAGLTVLFTTAWDAITTVFRTAWDVISTVVKVAWAVISGIITVGMDVLTTVFRTAWDVIAAVVKVAWAAIQAVVKVAFDIIVGIFSTGLDLITGHWGKAWTDIQTTAEQVWNAIKAFLSAAWNAISTLAVQIWNNIKSFFVSLWADITSTAKTAVSTITGVFTTFWGDLKTGFADAVAAIQKVWDTLQAVVTAPVKAIVNVVYDEGIVPVVNAVGSLIGLKLSKISFAEGGKVTAGSGPKSDDVLARVSKGETVVSAAHSQQLAPAFAAVGVPGYAAGGIPGGGVLGDIGHALGDVGGAVTKVASDIAKTLANLTGDALAAAASAILNPLLAAMPGGGTPLGADLKKIPQKMVSSLVNKLKGTSPPGGSGGGAAGTSAQVKGWITTALSDTGQPTSWLGPLETLVSKESGGKTSVVDPIAVDGQHATGIAQMLPATYAEYATVPGGIDNPVSNLVAAIRYIMATYGSPSSIPGLTGGTYKGYAGGGLPAGAVSFAGGGVIPEPVIGYGVQTGRKYGFGEAGPETVVPGVASSAAAGGRGGTVVNFNYYGPSAPTPEQQHALFLKASAMIGVS